MRIERQPAFVLHERPYRETSVLLEILSRDHGRVGLVARGVRSASPRHSRGSLKPLQALELSWHGRGELGNLIGFDPVGTPVPLVGEAALCALYLNELLMRLLARHDPHPGVFQRYSQVLFELAGAGTDGHAWVLRRFERDLLAELGYALVWETDVDGADVDASRRYVIDPERGPAPCDPMRSSGAVSGAALLALTREQSPSGELLRELRRMLRVVLRHHLGGRDLAAWSIRPPRLGPGPDLSE